MQCSIKRRIVQLAEVRLHALVVLSLLVLGMVGHVPDSQGGWITCPPQAVIAVPARRGRGCKEKPGQRHGATCWLHLFHTCSIPLMRSFLLWTLRHLSGQVGSAWVGMVPWGIWLWQRAGVLWPWVRRQPEWQGMRWLLWQGQRGLMVGYLGLAVGTLLRRESQLIFPPPAWDWLNESRSFWMVGLGCVVCHREEPWVEAVQEEDGSYTATLCGHFTLGVAGDHPFRVRMLMLFLRLLEVPGPQRGGRRTRAGRTPFVA